jgi:PRTRC genetic system protein E
MPLLKERTVMLTLSRIDEATLRVCVIPKRLKEDTKEDTSETAQCTPLMVTGNVDELDRDFSTELSRYTTSMITLGSNLAEVEAKHCAAVKAVEAEKKEELDRKRGKAPKASSTPGKSGPAIKDGKPVFGTRNGEGPAPAKSLSNETLESKAPTEQQPVGVGVTPTADDLEQEPASDEVPASIDDDHPTAPTAPPGMQGTFAYPE